MNNTQSQNPCIRCGKERIVSRVWKEEISTYFGTSEVEHTEMVCPDPQCQEALNEKFAKEKEKLDLLAKQKEERLQNAKNARQNAKN